MSTQKTIIDSPKGGKKKTHSKGPGFSRSLKKPVPPSKSNSLFKLYIPKKPSFEEVNYGFYEAQLVLHPYPPQNVEANSIALFLQDGSPAYRVANDTTSYPLKGHLPPNAIHTLQRKLSVDKPTIMGASCYKIQDAVHEVIGGAGHIKSSLLGMAELRKIITFRSVKAICYIDISGMPSSERGTIVKTCCQELKDFHYALIAAEMPFEQFMQKWAKSAEEAPALLLENTYGSISNQNVKVGMQIRTALKISSEPMNEILVEQEIEVLKNAYQNLQEKKVTCYIDNSGLPSDALSLKEARTQRKKLDNRHSLFDELCEDFSSKHPLECFSAIFCAHMSFEEFVKAWENTLNIAPRIAPAPLPVNFRLYIKKDGEESQAGLLEIADVRSKFIGLNFKKNPVLCYIDITGKDANDLVRGCTTELSKSGLEYFVICASMSFGTFVEMWANQATKIETLNLLEQLTLCFTHQKASRTMDLLAAKRYLQQKALPDNKIITYYYAKPKTFSDDENIKSVHKKHKSTFITTPYQSFDEFAVAWKHFDPIWYRAKVESLSTASAMVFNLLHGVVTGHERDNNKFYNFDGFILLVKYEGIVWRFWLNKDGRDAKLLPVIKKLFQGGAIRVAMDSIIIPPSFGNGWFWNGPKISLTEIEVNQKTPEQILQEYTKIQEKDEYAVLIGGLSSLRKKCGNKPLFQTNSIIKTYEANEYQKLNSDVLTNKISEKNESPEKGEQQEAISTSNPISAVLPEMLQKDKELESNSSLKEKSTESDSSKKLPEIQTLPPWASLINITVDEESESSAQALENATQSQGNVNLEVQPVIRQEHVGDDEMQLAIMQPLDIVQPAIQTVDEESESSAQALENATQSQDNVKLEAQPVQKHPVQKHLEAENIRWALEPPEWLHTVQPAATQTTENLLDVIQMPPPLPSAATQTTENLLDVIQTPPPLPSTDDKSGLYPIPPTPSKGHRLIEVFKRSMTDRLTLLNPSNYAAFALLPISIALCILWLKASIYPAVAFILIGCAGISVITGMFTALFFIPAAVYYDFMAFVAHQKQKSEKDLRWWADIGLSDIAAYLNPTRLWYEGIKPHYIQTTIVLIGLCLFITALVFTIGFFTAGVDSTFHSLMQPIFNFLEMALAQGLTGFSKGVVSILAAIIFVTAPLIIADILRRLASTIDLALDEKGTGTAETHHAPHQVLDQWLKQDTTETHHHKPVLRPMPNAKTIKNPDVTQQSHLGTADNRGIKLL